MNKGVFLLCLLSCLLVIEKNTSAEESMATGTVIKKIWKPTFSSKDNLLKTDRFQKYEKGFNRDENGIFVCDNGTSNTEHRGITQHIILNQAQPEIIVAGGWSRAENVSDFSSSNYSLYLDIQYQDGTWQYGVSVNFSGGTHDWEYKQVVFQPAKPIKSVSFYGLFRYFRGKVFFKDFILCTQAIPANMIYYDSESMTIVKKPPMAEYFLLRNTGKESDQFFLADPAANKANASLFDVTVTWTKTVESGKTGYQVKLENQTEEDRVLTFYYVVRLPEGEPVWFDNFRKGTKMEPGRNYSHTSHSTVGANGHLSLYPFGAVECGGKGIAIGLNPFKPVFFRVGSQLDSRELYLACDIALTREKKTAVLDFHRFEFPEKQGFRGAMDQYYRLWPEAFRCRIPEQGNWMPFAPISKVKNHEDFGFKFKEGNDETQWDDDHNIITFRYTEPMTWWMAMAKDKPRTMESALEQAKQMAKNGDRNAQALLTSGFYNQDGRYAAILLDTPWCDGAVWSMCDLPGLFPLVQKGKIQWSKEYPVTQYHDRWNDQYIEQNYPKSAKPGQGLDGEYLDSSEGYATGILNYRREHFSASERPLVYDRNTRKPGMFRGLITFEYLKGMAEVIHQRGRLMMANSTPIQLFWLAPYLDVLGTETNWNMNNRWNPMSDTELMYRRAMCGPKPYCFLMNTNFDDFSYNHSEKYMKRSLAYGMFPGYFSADASSAAYFTRPELYDRDRPLFKKYLPLCRRVAEAGWQPITGATSSDPLVYIERFGNTSDRLCFTVYNDSPVEKTVTISFESKSLELFGKPTTLHDAVSGKTLELKNSTFTLTIMSGDVAVIVR